MCESCTAGPCLKLTGLCVAIVPALPHHAANDAHSVANACGSIAAGAAGIRAGLPLSFIPTALSNQWLARPARGLRPARPWRPHHPGEDTNAHAAWQDLAAFMEVSGCPGHAQGLAHSPASARLMMRARISPLPLWLPALWRPSTLAPGRLYLSLALMLLTAFFRVPGAAPAAGPGRLESERPGAWV